MLINENNQDITIKENISQYTEIIENDYKTKKILVKRPSYYNINLECIFVLPGISVLRDNSEFIRRYTSKEHVFEYKNPEKLLIIHYVIEGQGQIEVSEDKFIPIKSNDIQIQFTPTKSTFSFYDKLKALHIIIDMNQIEMNKLRYPDDFKIILRKLFEECKEETVILLRDNNIILQLLKEMRKFQVDDKNLKIVHSQAKIIEILVNIYLSNLTSKNIEYKTYTDAQIRVVRKIKNNLSRDIASYISLEVLSMSYGINLTTLKNCFKDMYGKPLYTWYREYKFQRANDLIQNTDFPISKIAHMIGYKSSSKFTKAFKKEMGALPSSYRKKE